MIKNFLKTLFLICVFSNCKKNSDQEDLCSNIQNVTISSNSPLTVGATINFSAPEVGGYRIYSWVGPNNYTSQYPKNTITDAQFQNEGWYYLNLFSTNGSCSKIDSVYIDIKLQQESVPCTIGNNTANYNNLAIDNFSSVTKNIDPTYSQKVLDAYSGVFSSTTVYFHTHWRTFEPEDGVYYTSNKPVFDQTDFNYNKVFITATKSSIYWSSNEGQKVYVTHNGSKLQIRYCDLTMGGNNGTSYTTIATGNLLEQ